MTPRVPLAGARRPEKPPLFRPPFTIPASLAGTSVLPYPSGPGYAVGCGGIVGATHVTEKLACGEVKVFG